MRIIYILIYYLFTPFMLIYNIHNNIRNKNQLKDTNWIDCNNEQIIDEIFTEIIIKAKKHDNKCKSIDTISGNVNPDNYTFW